MHPEIQALAEIIEKAQALLTKHGEKHWASWLEQDIRRIRNLDLYGIEHFLSAFGGMGSINDLVLHPINGHLIQESEIDAANTELVNLLNRASALAKKLYSEDVSGDPLTQRSTRALRKKTRKASHFHAMLQKHERTMSRKISWLFFAIAPIAAFIVFLVWILLSDYNGRCGLLDAGWDCSKIEFVVSSFFSPFILPLLLIYSAIWLFILLVVAFAIRLYRRWQR